MALQERLQILVTADAKGAAREFQRVGDAADKNLGKADDRVAKLGATLTSFGTQTVLAAGVAGVGLFKAADAASAYGEQVSRATKTFGDEAVPELEAFADAAADTAGISKTAALQASSTFAAFGKQIGLAGKPLAEFSTQLVQSAGDFASLNDITVDQSLTTFISALSGEQEAIKRFGIDMSAAAVEAEALAMGISDGSGELTAQEKVLARQSILLREGALWAGDFADTSDSLANRQRALAAEFENAKVALGEGLLPLAESAVGAVQGLAESFGNLDPEMQSTIGKFAGMGVAAAGTVGALSLVAGQAIKMRDAFFTVSGSGADATRSLNNVGKAAGALGAVGIGAGIITGLYEITNAGEAATETIDNLKTAVAQRDKAEIVENLIERTRELDGAVEDVFEFLGDIGPLDVSQRFVNLAETRTDIYDLKTALEETTNAADGLAQIEAIRFVGFDGAGAEKLNTILDEQEARFKASERAANAAAIETGDFNDVSGFGANILRKFSGAVDKSASSLGDFSDDADEAAQSLSDTLDPFLDVIDAARDYDDSLRDLDDAKRDLSDLRSQGFDPSDEADGLRRIEDAARSVADAYRDVEDAQRDLADARLELQRINEDIEEVLREDIAGRQPGTRKYEEGKDQLKELLRDQEDATRAIQDAERGVADAERGVEEAKRNHADAQRDLNEARLEAIPTQRELEDAERGVADAQREVIDAALASKDAQAALNQLVADGEISIEDYHLALLTLAEDAPPEIQEAIQLMGAQFDWLTRKAGLAAGAIKLSFTDLFGGELDGPPEVGFGRSFLGPSNGVRTVGSVIFDDENYIGSNPHGPYPQRRAVGGPVAAGNEYFINERGDELFAPSTNGFVMNADKTNQLLDGLGKLISGGPQRGGNTYNVQVPERATPDGATLVRQIRASEWLHEGAA